jgi:hypothetical protein
MNRSSTDRRRVGSCGLPRYHPGLSPLPTRTFVAFCFARATDEPSPPPSWPWLHLQRARSPSGTLRSLRRALFLPLSRFTGSNRLSTVCRPMCPLPAGLRTVQRSGPPCHVRTSRSVLALPPRLDGLLHNRPPRACCIPLPVLRFISFPASGDRTGPKVHPPHRRVPRDVGGPSKNPPHPQLAPHPCGPMPS